MQTLIFFITASASEHPQMCALHAQINNKTQHLCITCSDVYIFKSSFDHSLFINPYCCFLVNCPSQRHVVFLFLFPYFIQHKRDTMWPLSSFVPPLYHESNFRSWRCFARVPLHKSCSRYWLGLDVQHRQWKKCREGPNIFFFGPLIMQ